MCLWSLSVRLLLFFECIRFNVFISFCQLYTLFPPPLYPLSSSSSPFFFPISILSFLLSFPCLYPHSVSFTPYLNIFVVFLFPNLYMPIYLGLVLPVFLSFVPSLPIFSFHSGPIFHHPLPPLCVYILVYFLPTNSNKIGKN